MLEKWKKYIDKDKTFGALLTDLSKAFDCLDHEFLIAKLEAYGLTLPASKLIQNYLSNRKQITKMNSSYSEWLEIIFWVPQGAIFGPLLLNIFLADLFFIVDDIEIASYADDSTPYVISKDIEEVIQSLGETSKILFKYFSNNLMKISADKCHLLVSRSNKVEVLLTLQIFYFFFSLDYILNYLLYGETSFKNFFSQGYLKNTRF